MPRLRRFDAVALNPQPIPPGSWAMLNPQPLPPGGDVMLNPQPLPPRYLQVGIIVVGG